ncbi:uncharacterized protein LOC111714640 [Eurytemora carolleeae]|uniref:uncharacterized protein LOC111714640 n=1 Tax=Eurytemora carolleeae TaxID=1294199 RepID=UPI000C75D73D|nr:uncharacterized protein LOC111714640 [Eurytemora carolleeae]|eukprot:XP_023345562.1 uncharacterized protein LOC111714640 [Eurytemora affinis]
MCEKPKFVTVDVIKSSAGLTRFSRSGVVYLQDCEVDIDGETELEKNKQLELANITFKNCSVSIKNLKIQSEGFINGKSLEFISCGSVYIENCNISCNNPGSDKAPYPNRQNTSCCVYALNSDLNIKNSMLEGSGLEVRGIIGDQSTVKILESTIKNTDNSGVWGRNKADIFLSKSQILGCGGYGAVYATNGATITVESCVQVDNPGGCGVFVLHEQSRVNLNNSSLSRNKWSGFGCRWSGGGTITNCNFDSNGQGAWAIRKSTIKDVTRRNNIVTNDFTDKNYEKVAFLFVDPLNTALGEKGLASRGLSVEKAKELREKEGGRRQNTKIK